MPKVVISGYYGFDNWGDEAILETAVAGLRNAVPGVEITVLSSRPEVTAVRHDIRAVKRTDPRRILREIHTCDMLISGGGSLLQDVTSSRSLWYYLAIILAAVRRGKKVMLYANGIGPIDRPLNRLITRWVLDQVSLITVRGPSSREFLAELGVTRPRIVETADTAFAVDPAPPASVAAICREEGLPDLTKADRPPFVGIVVRPWRQTDRLGPAVARAADYIAGKLGYGVVFLPVHRDLDLDAAQRVQGLMKHPSHLVRNFYAARETVALLGHFRWVLSMRLHPLIFAAVGGVPGIGLVYDPKVDEFLAQTGQVSVGPVEKAQTEDILLAINDVEADYDARAARLKEAVAELRRRARMNNELAAELLTGRRP